MPYVKKSQRPTLDKLIYEYFGWLTPHGNINYVLFKLAKMRCSSYNDYKEFIGELDCAKSEIKRRLLAPYEDEKIKENGDVE